jgi:tRNA1(Val) A37 N6-methylase TrmN6
LLCDFIKILKEPTLTLEIGCSNAALMILLSNKISGKIMGVEIQEERYLHALKNIEENNLTNRLSVIKGDINKLDLNQFNGCNLIVCNPPFYKMDSKKTDSNNDEKLIARFEKYLTFEQLVDVSSKILSTKGRLVFIHKPNRLCEIVKTLSKYNFAIKELQFVYHSIEHKPGMILVSAQKDVKEGLEVLQPLIING